MRQIKKPMRKRIRPQVRRIRRPKKRAARSWNRYA